MAKWLGLGLQGNSIRPVSPGTVGQSPAAQRDLACSMSAGSLATKFQFILRGPSSGDPPMMTAWQSLSAHSVTSSPSGNTTRQCGSSAWPSSNASPSRTYSARSGCSAGISRVVAVCMCTCAYSVGDSTGTGEVMQKPVPAIRRILTPRLSLNGKLPASWWL